MSKSRKHKKKKQNNKEILPSDVQKFYLLPQSWEKYSIARILEKPFEFLSGLINFVCINITNFIAYIFEFLISLFQKETAKDIGEIISKRYYIIPSFIIFFLYILDI